jgi:hypothetical protein
MAIHAIPCMAISFTDTSTADDISLLYQRQYTLFFTIIDYSSI